ncbi:alanyl-tRNA editing protein [Vibrio rhizosphaerae]|uniref:Alanyl-tRNA editing protein n=1 Tax=Vibrio rhizosphaerae TaxID=398736 RepID=A0ABU4IYI3_9VIBR|nr:alanyl-tRNA editing protein [Vibrio rhizosphaerae]MDW6094449.1 alanyl-tRNA editing protein [Vibrio rhizosphaerae]
MTKKIFWENPYQSELTSYVTNIDGQMIELSETIFYAESGGQESDHGTIGGIEVVHAEKAGKRIFYTLKSVPSFSVGDSVITQINWPRRYALMKLHFAAELVLECFYQQLTIEKIGAHIAADKSRIDFYYDGNIGKLAEEIEKQVQAIIDADLAIESRFSDISQERRYWKIDGFSEVPCGGTHIRRTSEVGKIKLRRKNPGRGKERVEITVE